MTTAEQEDKVPVLRRVVEVRFLHATDFETAVLDREDRWAGEDREQVHEITEAVDHFAMRTQTDKSGGERSGRGR